MSRSPGPWFQESNLYPHSPTSSFTRTHTLKTSSHTQFRRILRFRAGSRTASVISAESYPQTHTSSPYQALSRASM